MTEPVTPVAEDTAKNKDGAATGAMLGMFALLAVILIVVIGVSLTGDEEDRPSSVFTFSGTLELPARDADVTGQACTGRSPGYGDIRSGAEVTVYDAAGAIVATGSLGGGTVAGSRCAFGFDIPGVVRGDDLYQVEVANRGKVTVTSAEAETGAVSLTLG